MYITCLAICGCFHWMTSSSKWTTERRNKMHRIAKDNFFFYFRCRCRYNRNGSEWTGGQGYKIIGHFVLVAWFIAISNLSIEIQSERLSLVWCFEVMIKMKRKKNQVQDIFGLIIAWHLCCRNVANKTTTNRNTEIRTNTNRERGREREKVHVHYPLCYMSMTHESTAISHEHQKKNVNSLADRKVHTTLVVTLWNSVETIFLVQIKSNIELITSNTFLNSFIENQLHYCKHNELNADTSLKSTWFRIEQRKGELMD